MAEPIIVETPAGQRRRLAALGVIMTAVSACLVARRSDGTVGLAVGLVGLVFFGPITLALLVRALRNRPVLTLDADGFTDRSTLIAAGPVPWPDAPGGPGAGSRPTWPAARTAPSTWPRCGRRSGSAAAWSPET